MTPGVLAALLACSQPADVPGSPGVEARRKGPFDGAFVPEEVRLPPGTVVDLGLDVRAAVPAPGGRLRLHLPEGITWIEGHATTALGAWEGGERRSFRWKVRVDTAEERAVIADVIAEQDGRTWVGAFSAVFNPAPTPGWEEAGPGGKRRVVRIKASSTP